MKVWGMWHGGSSYAVGSVDEDTEEFSSLQAAKDALYDREKRFDPYYPCVEDSEMQVFFSDPRGNSDPYPDRILTIGPRGGVRAESC